MTKLDFGKVVPEADLAGDDPVDTEGLRALARDARAFLQSFSWCGSVAEGYFGLGVGNLVGVFLYRIVPAAPAADEWLWVVVGDIPPAYLTIDSAPNPACALDAYIGAMQEWVEAARSGKPTDGLIPVNVAPTPENASRLESRLQFLDREVLASYGSDLQA
jgi:hypothetical protein